MSEATEAQRSALATVVATLLPGDGAWPSAAELDLIDETLRIAALAPGRVAALLGLLDALPPDFAALDADGREAALRELESSAPAAFAAVLVPAYDAYYTSPRVLEVVERRSGYPQRAAQPEGHALPPFDESVLAVARTRAPLWREVGA